MYQQALVNIPNMKFHEEPSGGRSSSSRNINLLESRQLLNVGCNESILSS